MAFWTIRNSGWFGHVAHHVGVIDFKRCPASPLGSKLRFDKRRRVYGAEMQHSAVKHFRVDNSFSPLVSSILDTLLVVVMAKTSIQIK